MIIEELVIKDWKEYLDIEMDEEQEEDFKENWIDKNTGHLVLVECGSDYRDQLVRKWDGLFNNEFDKFLSYSYIPEAQYEYCEEQCENICKEFDETLCLEDITESVVKIFDDNEERYFNKNVLANMCAELEEYENHNTDDHDYFWASVGDSDHLPNDSVEYAIETIEQLDSVFISVEDLDEIIEHFIEPKFGDNWEKSFDLCTHNNSNWVIELFGIADYAKINPVGFSRSSKTEDDIEIYHSLYKESDDYLYINIACDVEEKKEFLEWLELFKIRAKIQISGKEISLEDAKQIISSTYQDHFSDVFDKTREYKKEKDFYCGIAYCAGLLCRLDQQDLAKYLLVESSFNLDGHYELDDYEIQGLLEKRLITKDNAINLVK